MKEIFHAIERKAILPAAVFAFQFCADVAHAKPPPADLDVRRAEYGEGYVLFERAVDQTSESELRAVGITGDSAAAKEEIKEAQYLIWPDYDGAVWNSMPVFAKVHYDIIVNGGRIFFEDRERSGAKDIVDYSNKDYEKDQAQMLAEIGKATGLPTMRVDSKNKANCVITLYKPDSMHRGAAGVGSRPAHSFSPNPAYISLLLEPLTARRYTKVQFTDGFRRFWRSRFLVKHGIHEFSHGAGLGHTEDKSDVMSPESIEFDFIHPRTEEVTDNPDIYHEKGAMRVLDMARKEADVYDSVQIVYKKKAETSKSMKLLRWLRSQALNGKLKDLLLKAEDIGKRERKKKENKPWPW